jgi:hypothetical protein
MSPMIFTDISEAEAALVALIDAVEDFDELPLDISAAFGIEP